jgi:type VI secretion system protein ImpK
MTYATQIGGNNAADDDLSSLIGPDAALTSYTDLNPSFYPRVTDQPSRLASSHNPLVAAASRLLSGIARLKPHRDASALEQLRARLGRRVSRFARQALQAGVSHANVRIASYLLCTVADEAVLSRDWGKNSDWASDSLLHAFHGDTQGGEKFFHLLERFKVAPAIHIDHLELMYLCLALGFKGRHAASADNGRGLLSLRDELYRCIRRVRGETVARVSPFELPPVLHGRRSVNTFPVWLPLAAAALGLAAIYSSLAWKLAIHREQAVAAFEQTTPPPSATSGKVAP